MTVTSDHPDLASPDLDHDVAAPTRFSDYYELTKPRLNFLVILTTFVGYFIAARCTGHAVLDWMLVHVVLGTALTAASAAVLNQAVEHKLDARMRRTSDRPIASGRLSAFEGYAFGIAIGVGGMLYLSLAVNWLTAMLGAITWVTYLFIYTPLKTRSPLNTLVGAVTGALPPAMGVTAVTGAITPLAGVLFGILFVWQMPHFYALSLMYRDDYAAGGFRMLPSAFDGDRRTRLQALLYALALLPISLLPVLHSISRAGWLHGVCATLLGMVFIRAAMKCVRREPGAERKLFFASITYLPLVLGALMADQW